MWLGGLGNFAVLISLVFTCTFVEAVTGQEICKGDRIFNAEGCVGDNVSADEAALFEAVNQYRTENGRPALKFSAALNMVANRRVLDLNQNMKAITHSWSNCPYDIADQKTWPCQTASPRRLNSGYKGDGYETIYGTTSPRVDLGAALAAWKKSETHRSIILNKGLFESMPWDEMGVAIGGSYASLWFGYLGSPAKVESAAGGGPAGSYDQMVAKIFESLAIEQRSVTTESNGLRRGMSPNNKLKAEIWGSKPALAETSISITVTTSADGRIDSANRSGISKILRDLFPEVSDVDTWLDNSIDLIAQNRTAWKVKTIRGITVEMKASGSEAIMLSLKPPMKAGLIEM